ncbi:hypothetical protein FQR65_LT00782 [Abscondita terminalis]|nr:hypothetical protein FQR65_LT00782 [Abscondita terminalis]
MEVLSGTSLQRPDLVQSESDDDLSFVVLGHSLCPEASEELVNDLTDAIETSVISDEVKLSSSDIDQKANTMPSFSLMHQMDKDLSSHTRDVSLNTVATNSVDLSPDEIQSKVDMLVDENFKLKETLHQNNLAMKKQYDTLVLWQDDVMSVHKSHKEKFAETKVYIEKLKLEKAELVNIVHLKEAEITLLMEQINELKATTSLKRVPQMENELEDAKKKIVELEQLLETEKSTLIKEISARQSFKQHFEDLQGELFKQKSDNEQLEMKLNKAKRESDSLQKVLLDEIKGLREKLMNESTQSQHHDKIVEQLMAAQMHITELQLSSDKDKDTINSNEKKIQMLDKQIAEIQADNKALQMQVELFQKDFLAEQQAKTALGVEKETVADDLRNLQRRNQQLLEEVEKLRKNGYVFVGSEEGAVVSAPEPAPQQWLHIAKPGISSSADTSLDHRQILITVPENEIKEVFLNEDTLLEKPLLFPKQSELTDNQYGEFGHLYYMADISDPVINSSVTSQNSVFSGFEGDDSGTSDYSGLIPVATPIVVKASTSGHSSENAKTNSSEKENNMNVANITNDTNDEKKLNFEENDLNSIQSRMMDANDCDMSLFESFYSFVCKLYTKNETISEEIASNSINPSQLHINLLNNQIENSPYKSSYLQLESTSLQPAANNNGPSTSSSTPVKQKLQDYVAVSPELFSDEESAEISTQNSQLQCTKNAMFTTDNDHILLKKVRDSLGGVPPPPSITISIITASEILDKVKENYNLFITKEELNNLNTDGESRRSLLLNCNECDTVNKSFPDIMNFRYHGLHHNRSKVSEEFEHLCIKYTERCIGAETQSTCTTFGVNNFSPSKRKLKCRKVSKSPGKRLSHLARRRITFSKDSLHSNMNTSSCSFIGSRTRQIMVDARKYELLSRRTSPKKKSPRKTPAKSPRRKGTTPRSSGKKKQFHPQAIEESLDTLSSLSSSSSKPSTTKRALFQSPNKDSNCSSLLSFFNTAISSLYPARRKMTPKRALFKSPDKQSPFKSNEVCDKKRKRTDMDDGHPSKISKNISGEISDLDSSNEIKSESVSKASSSIDIMQHRKKKLLWTVGEALRSQNIDFKHPQFKVYASVLARLIRHFLPTLFTNGPRPEGSTTESMLRVARQYVFAVTRGKTVDQIIRESQKNKPRLRRPSGYIGLDKINDPVSAFQVKNKENILQDRVNIMEAASCDNKQLNKTRRSENVERIRRVINFGEGSETTSNPGIR